MSFWDVVWAAALGTAISGLAMAFAAKVLGLIVKGMDKEAK